MALQRFLEFVQLYKNDALTRLHRDVRRENGAATTTTEGDRDNSGALADHFRRAEDGQS